jgi:ketosteroid isomerase-like protein
MKSMTKVILVLGCVVILWIVQNGKGGSTTESNVVIEKAILKVHMEMMKAAENLDADALFSHVLDMNKGVIVQDGKIMTTRREALDGTRQGLQGLKSVSYKYDHKHITVISPTVALWVGDGTSSVTFSGNGGEMSIAFAETILFTKKDGQWKVIHAHRSIPNPR